MITITNEFRYLMALLGNAATGKTADNAALSVDIDMVMNLANRPRFGGFRAKGTRTERGWRYSI